jgi:hypothetical protein
MLSGDDSRIYGGISGPRTPSSSERATDLPVVTLDAQAAGATRGFNRGRAPGRAD